MIEFSFSLMGLHYLVGLPRAYSRNRGIGDAYVTVTSEMRAVFEYAYRRHLAKIC